MVYNTFHSYSLCPLSIWGLGYTVKESFSQFSEIMTYASMKANILTVWWSLLISEVLRCSTRFQEDPKGKMQFLLRKVTKAVPVEVKPGSVFRRKRRKAEGRGAGDSWSLVCRILHVCRQTSFMKGQHELTLEKSTLNSVSPSSTISPAVFCSFFI